MGLSDSPATCTSAARLYAFADRSWAMEDQDVAGVSRLPRERFPTVRVVSDSVRAASDSPVTSDIAVAFPVTGQGRPYKMMFSELNTRPGCASVNASRRRLLAATHHSRPERLAKPYPVRLFHPRPSSGLRRRTLSPLPSSLPTALDFHRYIFALPFWLWPGPDVSSGPLFLSP